jgi:hypothetical protein
MLCHVGAGVVAGLARPASADRVGHCAPNVESGHNQPGRADAEERLRMCVAALLSGEVFEGGAAVLEV